MKIKKHVGTVSLDIALNAISVTAASIVAQIASPGV